MNGRARCFTASVNVIDAILVNVLALERRALIQFHTVAIARAACVCTLLLVALSRCTSERLVIGARLDRYARQCECGEYEDDGKGQNAAFHDEPVRVRD